MTHFQGDISFPRRRTSRDKKHPVFHLKFLYRLNCIGKGTSSKGNAYLKHIGGIVMNAKKPLPSIDQWLKEAKNHESASNVGMYLTHNGIVRQTAKAAVRQGAADTSPVTGMIFSYDQAKVDAVIADTYKMDGVYYIKVWLNEGQLQVGDDIMYVLIGGDIRPRVVDALQYLVGRIKNECVTETELYQ